MQIDRSSTEYLYIGVTGDVPSVSAEVAFVIPPARPAGGDWDTAIIVGSNAHALWDDAQASGVTGDYYVAILVGSFGGGTVVLTGPADYQAWLRLTDTTEQPVRIAPATVEVL
jgi:hypothetical protein